MSEAMVAEKGLLNHAQAALVLGVSVKRIGELVRQDKLTRFDFFDRTYVSMREICKRDNQEIEAGKRSKAAQVLGSIKAAFKTDSVQMGVGGYAGPYHEAERQKRIAARKSKAQKKK